MTHPRRLPVGAEPAPEGVHFRVWAPDHTTVRVVVERLLAMARLERAAREDPGLGPGR